MGKYIDLIGLKFGKLTVISYSHMDTKRRVAVWNCLCDCGNKWKATGVNLREKQVKSCGCWHKEAFSNIIPKTFIDLTGKKFGKLTVLCRSTVKNYGNIVWVCLCECGVTKNVDGGNLKTGRQVSCGCSNRQNAKENHTTHNMSNTRIYNVWAGMISRCYNINVTGYNNYGGRGISVSEEWISDFVNFYNDMNPTHEDHLQLDRIDVDGNYCNFNCRWVTTKDNCRNKRDTIYITIGLIKKSMSEWAEIYKLSYHSLYRKYKSGFKEWDKIFKY